MHILMGLLGTIVTILILVKRLTDAGIDVGWLNPFAWKRRRDWAKKLSANPVYCLTDPMDVTAFILVALAKREGEISREQKTALLAMFRNDFHLDERRAAALFTSSSFLVRDGTDPLNDMSRLLAASRDRFSDAQIRSAMSMFDRISRLDSTPSDDQQRVIRCFAGEFAVGDLAEASW